MRLAEAEILPCFRDERYESLNRTRWEHFLSMGIPIEGLTIFEPGAGVGDQTAWLLSQGAAHINVNEGRFENLEIISRRFNNDFRLTLIPGDLEACLSGSQFQFNVDLVFCYGVYYHLRESIPEFPIMRQFSRIGQMIVFDYLTGNDEEVSYGYDNPSTSLSTYAMRPRSETLMAALNDIWEYIYLPKEQLRWVDPVQTENRLVVVASHNQLDNPNLELQ